MSDNKKPNDPFESHIESDAFDVSRLDEVPSPDQVDRDIRAFFARLPTPIDHELWDTMLDDEQKRICAHLTTEIVEKVARKNHADDLAEFSDEKIIYLYTIPVMLGMLAERELHKPAEPPPPAKPHPLNDTQAPPPPDYSEVWAAFQHSIQRAYQRLKEIVIKFYERMTR